MKLLQSTSDWLLWFSDLSTGSLHANALHGRADTEALQTLACAN